MVCTFIKLCMFSPAGWDEIFVKDQPFRVEKFFREGRIEEVFPNGYVYSFIIRHPAKTISSLYNGVTNFKNGVGKYIKPMAIINSN